MKKFEPKELLFFNRLVIPELLTGVYWLLLILIILGGLATMVNSSFLAGLFAIIFGFVSLRVSFEVIFVLFSINRNLEKLVDISQGTKTVVDENDVIIDEISKAE
ncbi:DUF4282 domain-containing protein [Utexia brackfieldae]|uniref:DUF4282 domain-containing protein n=1 Tax=Utexia brackfieldae TaxID=3074108 RepID=UPI00370DB38F